MSRVLCWTKAILARVSSRLLRTWPSWIHPVGRVPARWSLFRPRASSLSVLLVMPSMSLVLAACTCLGTQPACSISSTNQYQFPHGFHSYWTSWGASFVKKGCQSSALINDLSFPLYSALLVLHHSIGVLPYDNQRRYTSYCAPTFFPFFWQDNPARGRALITSLNGTL